MSDRLFLRKESYHDSVLLMSISQELTTRDGIEDAVVVMGTPHNKDLLAGMGFLVSEMDPAGPNDLIIAVRAEEGAAGDEAIGRCASALDSLLTRSSPVAAGDDHRQEGRLPRSLNDALDVEPDCNLALISVPGRYAAREARRALARRLHVMLFSDNVSLEDEVALKTEAIRQGLLCMGPDCGTAIVNGMPLAFANVVRQGTIGIVGASGTGIQEISCCIHRLGGGVSQAIGTGGRDLSDRVGGMMTGMVIRALAEDPETSILVLVSKPPSPDVARTVVEQLARAGKPAVVHFVGGAGTDPEADPAASGRVVFADTLAGAAEKACRLAGLPVAETDERPASGLVPPAGQALDGVITAQAAKLDTRSRLVGLFCGGTTGQEALALLERAGHAVNSNLHKDGPRRVRGIATVDGHVVLDLGDDLFTAGRPHPMIEPRLRNERLEIEMNDPASGLILCDVLLGHGSHRDPAGMLAEGIEQAARTARRRAREIVVVASITGTDRDPQDFDVQQRKLEDAGVIVLPDNRSAARFAAAVLDRIN